MKSGHMKGWFETIRLQTIELVFRNNFCKLKTCYCCLSTVIAVVSASFNLFVLTDCH